MNTQEQKTQDATRILDKLKKIMALRDGAGTPEEAEAAAAKLQELLIQHKVELSQVEAHNPETFQREDIGKTAWVPLYQMKKGSASLPDWVAILADVVATAHCCRAVMMVPPKGKKSRFPSGIAFIGETTDRQLAIYMHSLLVSAAERESLLVRRRHREAGMFASRDESKRFRASFYFAFVARIHQRYEEMKAKVESEQSTALMVISKSLARVDKKIEADGGTTEHIVEQDMSHTAGAMAGIAAAEKQSLNARAIENGGDRRSLGAGKKMIGGGAR